MSLRIIKGGYAKTEAIYPFSFAAERAKHQPEPYILPESASGDELSAVTEEESPEIAAVEAPPAPAVDIEQIGKDAFDRGYAEGRNEGRNEGLAEGLKTGEETAAAQIEEMTRRYTDSLAEVAVLKDTLRAQVEEEVVRLALTVAKKIVHREIHVDPTIIHTLVRIALERVSGKSAVVVRLSPSDYEYMTSRHKDMSQIEGRDIRFESDGTITLGGCVIQSESGDIDARVEEEFREVESSFFEGFE